jgi:hypothetical protein
VEPAVGEAVSAAALRDAASQAVGPAELPLYVLAAGRPLALAELFRLLAESLATYADAGELPAGGTVGRLRGATAFDVAGAAPIELGASDVLAMASALAARYALPDADPAKLFAPPASVVAGASKLHPSGALRAMASLYVHLHDGTAVPDALAASALPVASEALYTAAARLHQLWQLKPAVWQ